MLSAVVAFVATKTPAEARRFYAETLELKLVSDDDYALVFDISGTMLRVQKVQELVPTGYTALGWLVPDIQATAAWLAGKGISLERYGFLEHDAQGIWSAPSGAKVAWFKDPDGNTLSLTQPQ